MKRQQTKQKRINKNPALPVWRVKQKFIIFIVFTLLFILVSATAVSAKRLPTVGGDSNQWGTKLNQFLNISHTESGELRDNVVLSRNILNGTIEDADILDTTNLTLGEKITFALGGILDNIVNGWMRITGNLNVTGNITVNGDANSLMISGASTGNPIILIADGTDSDISIQLTPKGNFGTIAIGPLDGISYIEEFHSGSAGPGIPTPTPIDFLIQQRLTNGWSGATITSASSDGTWPYVEFLKARGSLATPTAVAVGDLVGEVASIGFTGTAYRVLSLIDFRAIGNGRAGQIEFTIADASGVFNQNAPTMIFNTKGIGIGATTLSDLTYGLEVYRKGSTSNIMVRRGNNANYAYTGYLPAGALSSSNVHWGAGFYANSNNYEIWSYDGTSNSERFVITNSGNVGIGTTSPNSKLHVVGEVNITGISADGTGKVVCIKSDGNLGTCTDQPGAGGTCTCA